MITKDVEYKKLIGLMRDLFISRTDAYALQRPDGAYKGGIKDPITNERIYQHLRGEKTVGVYQIEQGTNFVKWGCFDIDAEHCENPKKMKVALYDAIIRRGVPKDSIVIEESGTPDSYHLWLFFTPTTTAKEARAFMKEIRAGLGIPEEELEIFPKQDEVGKDERDFGNLVKLPLGKHRKKEKWSVLTNITGNRVEGIEVLKSVKKSPVPPLLIGLRPCFKRAIISGLQLNGSSGDEFRLAMLCELQQRGNT